MGDDDQANPGEAQAPNTLDGLPADLAAFLDCRAAVVELTPGKQAWLSAVPNVGDFLGSADIAFEGEKDGSVKAIAKLGESAFSGSASVKLKVDADGKLVVDASDSTLINAFKPNIDEWTRDVNNWFASNGKVLAPPTVKGQRVTFTKIPADTLVAVDGAKPGLLPHVPLVVKVGAIALFVVAIAFALLLLPNDTTTTRTVAQPSSFVRVVTTEDGGPPWSLLLIPGSALVLGGGLVLDERRRRTRQP